MNRLDVSLHADEPLRAGLLRIGDSLIQNAADRIMCPTSDPGEDVHLVRVTIKRLRALLRLIRPVISRTAFDRENKRLRKAASRLSSARDLDIARQTLATLPDPNGGERDAAAVVLAGFDSDGDSEVKVSKAMKQILRDLERTRRNLHRIGSFGREWKTIEPGLKNVYRQCRKRMEKALGQHDDEAFHNWRIRVKNLYYELQMLEPVWPERLKKMIERLKQLQERIGADHDLVVLKRSLQNTPDAFGSAETIEEIVGCLDGKSRKLRQATEPLGQRIFHQTSNRFVGELGRHWTQWRSRRKAWGYPPLDNGSAAVQNRP
jgi:CHAD domain-containing protein